MQQTPSTQNPELQSLPVWHGSPGGAGVCVLVGVGVKVGVAVAMAVDVAVGDEAAVGDEVAVGVGFCVPVVVGLGVGAQGPDSTAVPGQKPASLSVTSEPVPAL